MTNWDGSNVIWTNGNNAIFGGTGESIAVNAAITAGDITFNSTGYSIANGTGVLTVANASNNYTVMNLSDTATITETIAGTGNGIPSWAVPPRYQDSADTMYQILADGVIRLETAFLMEDDTLTQDPEGDGDGVTASLEGVAAVVVASQLRVYQRTYPLIK